MFITLKALFVKKKTQAAIAGVFGSFASAAAGTITYREATMASGSFLTLLIVGLIFEDQGKGAVIAQAQADAAADAKDDAPEIGYSKPTPTGPSGFARRISPLVLGFAFAGFLASCQGSLPSKLVTLNDEMRVAATAGFDVADELAQTETDPAKREKLRAKIAKVRATFLIASTGFNAVLIAFVEHTPPASQPATTPIP